MPQKVKVSGRRFTTAFPPKYPIAEPTINEPAMINGAFMMLLLSFDFGAGPNNVVDTTVFGVAVSIVVFRHSILKVTRGHDPATDMLGGDMWATCYIEVDAVEHVLSLVLKECDNTRTAHPMVDTDCVSLYKLSPW